MSDTGTYPKTSKLWQCPEVGLWLIGEVLIVTTSTTTQPQNGDEDEYSNVLLRHVAHQDDDTV